MSEIFDGLHMEPNPKLAMSLQRKGLRTQYEARFFMLLDTELGTCEGCGFTIHGARRTNFWTFSEENSSVLMSDYDHAYHLVDDLLRRGLKVPDTQRDEFLERWGTHFEKYKYLRWQAPPRGKTLSQAIEEAPDEETRSKLRAVRQTIR